MKRAAASLLLAGAALGMLGAAAAQRAPSSGPLSISASTCPALAEDTAGRTTSAAIATTVTGRAGAIALPAFCRVTGTLRPVAGSRIGFQLWLPQDWNGRFQMLGNGGYSSMLPIDMMAHYLRQGYAVTATDTGHEGDDPDFAVGHPQAIADWSWRAVHETAVAARALVTRYYGRAPDYRYFFGCSTGGHQAFSEAQRFPGDFQGIIAGAPGYDRVRLNAGFLWQFLSNHRPGDNANPILGQPQLDLLQKASLATCRRTNGGVGSGLASDPWIDDPLSCHFDPAVLQCPAKGDDSKQCLTPAQVSAARKMYRGATDPAGRQVFFPWPAGSEAQWSIYWADPARPTQPMRVNFWRIWAFDNPQWNWWHFSFGADLTRVMRKLSPRVDASNPDLDAFAADGGKMIHYHGLADPVVPPLDSIAYHDRVVARVAKTHARAGQRVGGYYRLFLAPGVGHCMGGAGPDQFNLQQAIEAWVEKDHAPDRLIASTRPSAPEQLSRPLCPYPAIARYARGPRDQASSFVCVRR